MLFVELLEQVERIALGAIGCAWGRSEVEQRSARAAEQGALLGGGHVSGGPVGSAADGAAARVGHDYETGQILVVGTEAVAEPGAQAGLADGDVAGVHLQTAGS